MLKALWKLNRNAGVLFYTNHGRSALQNSICTATFLPSSQPSKNGEPDMVGTAGEIKTFSYGLLHMNTPESAGQQKITFISFVWILGAV